MSTIYVYRNPGNSLYWWAELRGGCPVHAADLPDRVLSLLRSNTSFSTVSPLVLDIVGAAIRQKMVPLPVRVVYVDKDGRESEPNPFDTKGELIRPWPEEGEESIFEASFYWRYSDESIRSKFGEEEMPTGLTF